MYNKKIDNHKQEKKEIGWMLLSANYFFYQRLNFHCIAQL